MFTVEGNILEYHFYLRKELLENKLSNNLKYAIQRHYLETAEEACLKYIRKDVLNFCKINVFTMAAITSRHDTLR